MFNDLECQLLFAYSEFFLKDVFNGIKYPWELLPRLKELIDSIIKSGLAGFTLLKDGVIVGKDVKIAESATIDGPTVIGDGCEIRHGAYIRGSVILGKGCVVGNSCEIKNSILMDYAQVPHFNYVGDSILGKGVHLGAGVICSNLRSDKKSVIIKSEDLRFDTGLRKLGAILGDGVEVGCGTVLCPGTVIGKNTSVYPLTMTRGVYPANSIVKNEKTVISRGVNSD